ncbi:MAG: hypothetical protein JWS12_812 [Candidatus Saccharibacteria bacterium]|nr:hypothetical protein [Candidatus Saccharibacteria bacterium]
MPASKSMWKSLLVGLVLGVVGLIVARYLTIKPNDVHYHANFGLYVNGVRDDFKNFTFYEEIQSCDAHGSDNPKTRAHMHDNNNHVVHVHDHAVTWGAFFDNLGYHLGDKVIETDKGVFADAQAGNHLTFWLNNQPVDSIANRIIGDKDVLLVSYGSDDAAGLKKQYDSIPHDAEKFDKGSDPASCSGAEKLTFTTKLKKAVGINQP